MKGIEIISWAFVSVGLLGLYLNIRKNKWCWYAWAVANFGLVLVNIYQKSYSQAIYFGVCFGSCFLGMRQWSKEDQRKERRKGSCDHEDIDW